MFHTIFDSRKSAPNAGARACLPMHWAKLNALLAAIESEAQRCLPHLAPRARLHGRSLPRGAFDPNLAILCLPGVKRPLTALEAHFPFFAACSVVSPPLASPLRGLLVWPQTDVWPVFWVSTRIQASLHSPCFGSV